MRIIVSCAILMASILLTQNANAGCTATACGNEKIARLFVLDTGDVHVRSAGDQTILGCQRAPGNYITLKREDPGFYAIYSMLLSVQSQDKTLRRIRIKNSPTGDEPCEVQYVWQDSP